MSAVNAKEDKQQKVATMRQQVAELAKRIADPDFGDQTFKTYLEFLAKFRQYSFTNVCLIAMQRPNATYVAGFRRWLELKRYVRKGEKGIAIFVPFVSKRSKQDESTDDETEPSSPRAVHFGVGYVFDVSQTDGEGEVPSAFRVDLDGDVGPIHQALTQFAAAEGIAVKDGAWLSTANSITRGASTGGTVFLNEEAPLGSQVQTLVHELAHEFLHQQQKDAMSTVLREGEAEAVTCVVMQHLGFDTAGYNADYIRSHGCTGEQIAKSMDRIAVCARRIVDGVIAQSQGGVA